MFMYGNPEFYFSFRIFIKTQKFPLVLLVFILYYVHVINKTGCFLSSIIFFYVELDVC